MLLALPFKGFPWIRCAEDLTSRRFEARKLIQFEARMLATNQGHSWISGETWRPHGQYLAVALYTNLKAWRQIFRLFDVGHGVAVIKTLGANSPVEGYSVRGLAVPELPVLKIQMLKQKVQGFLFYCFQSAPSDFFGTHAKLTFIP